MLKRLFCLSAVWMICLAAQVPGSYSGTWTSTANGGAGKLNISITDEALTSASFSFQGQDVDTKAISLKKISDGIEFVFEYNLADNVLRSTMRGSATPTGMKGTYKSATPDGATPVDEGTWEVTQKK